MVFGILTLLLFRHFRNWTKWQNPLDLFIVWHSFIIVYIPSMFAFRLYYSDSTMEKFNEKTKNEIPNQTTPNWNAERIENIRQTNILETIANILVFIVVYGIFISDESTVTLCVLRIIKIRSKKWKYVWELPSTNRLVCVLYFNVGSCLFIQTILMLSWTVPFFLLYSPHKQQTSLHFNPQIQSFTCNGIGSKTSYLRVQYSRKENTERKWISEN